MLSLKRLWEALELVEELKVLFGIRTFEFLHLLPLLSKPPALLGRLAFEDILQLLSKPPALSLWFERKVVLIWTFLSASSVEILEM